jgi:uncharacterized protein YndB with AHSA1/START domain
MPRRIYTVIDIAQPVEEVYAYVTTPGHWPDWHPSSLAVSGATDHSLAVGEQVTEDYLVAGRRGQLTWAVTARDAPRRWVIAGARPGGSGTITYTLTPRDGGTHFEREFTYTLDNLLFAIADRLVLHRRVVAESAEALRRLKQRLEG